MLWEQFENWKFTGQERDRETGLDFFQARYYGAALGRFTSPDPENAGADPYNPQSWNGYAYVMNSPLTYTDPSGQDPVIYNPSQGIFCPPESGSCWPVTIPPTGIENKGTVPSGSGFEELGLFAGESAGLPSGLGVPSWGWFGGSGGSSCDFGSCGGVFSNSILGPRVPPQVAQQIDNQIYSLAADFLRGIQIWLHGRDSGEQPGPDVLKWANQQRTSVHGPWTYGNWCGTGGSGSSVDGNDRACMVHDYCYAQNGFTKDDNFTSLPKQKAKALQKCNQALCNSEAAQGGWTAFQIRTYFQRFPEQANQCH